MPSKAKVRTPVHIYIHSHKCTMLLLSQIHDNIAVTVLVQDLCYSDPLSSVLTTSDPIAGRDELSLHCSSLSLCMYLHASMRVSCNMTDRTTFILLVSLVSLSENDVQCYVITFLPSVHI